MQSFLIREATPSDADSISTLLRELGYTLSPHDVVLRLDRYNEDFSRVWVATKDSEIVGFISFHSIPLFHQSGSLGRITAMEVSSAHRRCGIGSSLLHHAEVHAMNLNCIRIEVTSGDHREFDAHKFYESQGYYSDCRRFLKSLEKDTEQGAAANP